MATLYTEQSKNIWKTWFLMTGFLVVVIALGWYFGFALDLPWLLPVAVVFSLIMNVASYWWSDKIVLKMSGARPASREKFFDFYTATENLAITAGLPLPKLYVIDDPSPNAFATGRDKDHAVVAATTGLLAILERNELEGVVAHELSHIGNRDMLLSTVVVVLVGFVAILSDFFLRFSFSGGGDRDNKGNAILIVVGIALAILAPIVATLIQLAVSRKREFLADASGALLTRYPEGLAKALEKISASGVPVARASNATAHLYIANPFRGGRVSGLHKLFLTHPPVEERLAALRGMSVE
ncbi:MAG: zinc metalloprotease HtpX [Candidatus Vogelbacteria bacterium RIFOXYD1_FULL_44_32]|uniref:Protease HtpX homolog n=1 Tax=Candidatus Vogelbacteria bacterium RIFOXYD1_FULL_44_32 TaxID=1802438 RepID=A0A1G2QDF1_9BACT|nr:MAG: zinc metalloprotease HtpX [Candidatus Vogelbacteria bacterium RIFOXYD1_FULL_44_32]